MLPTFYNYMEDRYSSSNYGVHSLCFDLGAIELWYSYKTIIAFKYKNQMYVHVNDWSTTTGKHLNAIDNGDKKNRLSDERFQSILTNILHELKLG
jgi:hypothetical protein